MNSYPSLIYWKDTQGIYLGYYSFGQIEPNSLLTAQTVIGKTDFDLFPAEIADINRQQDLEVMAKGCEIVFDISPADCLSSDIKQRVSKKPLLDINGNINGVIANVYLDERQAIKQVVEEAIGMTLSPNLTNLEYVKYLGAFFENFICGLPAHIFWVNTDNIYMGVNHNLAKYLGFQSTKDIIGKTHAEIFLESNAKKHALANQEVETALIKHAANLDRINKIIMQSGQTHTMEEFAQQPDWTDIFFTQKTPLKDLNNNVIGLIGASFNITETKRNEEQRLTLMLEASHAATWTWNFNDDTFIHDYMRLQGPYRIAGSLEEVITRAHPADRTMLQQELQQARKHRNGLDLEYRLTWIDGNQRHFAMRGKVVENKQGQPYCMVGICWDITERKQQEEIQQRQQVVMAQVSRQNAMGELASTLAHELNQPLAAISNYIDGCIIRLQKGHSNVEDILKAMHQASVQSARAGEIIHRIKNFMRKGELTFSAVNINNVIKDVIATMQFELKSNQIELYFELMDVLPNLQIDEIQIGQVVLNLLRNAIEAMREANVDAPKIIIKTIRQAEHIHIDVIDNGPGCPTEIANQLFTAYFTTKKNGMGIGLAICRSIVEAHNGQLIIMPNQQGAWFRFTLPVGGGLTQASYQIDVAYPGL